MQWEEIMQRNLAYSLNSFPNENIFKTYNIKWDADIDMIKIQNTHITTRIPFVALL